MKTIIAASLGQEFWEIKEDFPFIPRVGENIRCGDKDGSSYEVVVRSVSYTNQIQMGKHVGEKGSWIVYVEADVIENDGALDEGD